VISALAGATSGKKVRYFPFYVRSNLILQYVVFDKASKVYFPVIMEDGSNLINTAVGYSTIWSLMFRVHKLMLSIKSNIFVFGINLRILESYRKCF
jgi:hypothetical protein